MIKIALIGHGYWGKKLLRYLKADKRFEVKHICNSKTDMALVWSEIEAVVIATPIETHYQIVKKALSQKKHVFSEKPLALTYQECQELKNISEKKNLVLAVEYTQTFSKSLKKAASEIDIGPIQSIEMFVKHLGRFLKFDVYWLLASHCLSILDMFVSLKNLQFKKIDFIKNHNLVESGQILFWNREIRGQISVSLNFPGKQYQVIVYGKKGTIVYDAIAKPSLKATWYKKKIGLLPRELVYKQKVWNINEQNNLKYAVDYFYKIIKNQKKSNLERAITITQILEKLNK